MEHLHNFLKEIQSLPISKEKYYGLAKDKNAKHIHHSELKEGQEFEHECEKIAISENFVSEEYKTRIYELVNIALTETILLSESQQMNIIATLKIIKHNLVGVDNSISKYLKDNNQDTFDELEIHILLQNSFPLATIPYGKVDNFFKWRLGELINIKVKALDYVINSLRATIYTASNFTEYGKYSQPRIKDPYLIIECATSGLLRIKQQFKEENKVRGRMPDYPTPNNFYTSKDMIPVRIIYAFYIAQELPFIDFILFKNAVRKLLLNVPNKDELKTILEVSYRIAKENVEFYLSTILHLEELRGNKSSKKVPAEFKGIEVTSETKYLTFTKEFTTVTHYEEFAENDMTSTTNLFLNRDFAIHSERIAMFLNNEVFKGEEIQQKVVERTNAINIRQIEKLSDIVKGFFDKPDLLKSVLQGVKPTTQKLVFTGNAKTLCLIFKFLCQHGIINNTSATVQAWLVDNFEYTSKGIGKSLVSSTVARNFETNVHTPPIKELSELV